VAQSDSNGAGRVDNAPNVLIVDSSRDSREILRLLLELRGATTLEADRPEEAVRIAGRCRPDLIVFDAESDDSPTGEPTNDLRQLADRNHTPIVILGKVRHFPGPLPLDQIVAKPYHYGPLIRKINDLLAAA
jgi:PleD family two-component response regulator